MTVGANLTLRIHWGLYIVGVIAILQAPEIPGQIPFTQADLPIIDWTKSQITRKYARTLVLFKQRGAYGSLWEPLRFDMKHRNFSVFHPPLFYFPSSIYLSYSTTYFLRETAKFPLFQLAFY